MCSGAVQRAFAVVRPPGHHAECARAMGFCFYNNVAVAALAARRSGAECVLVLDWDVHHGNGIEEILYERPDIMYISLHRCWPPAAAIGNALCALHRRMCPSI